MALPHYFEDAFLRRAVRRYKMYLALKRRHPKVFLVPTYDMDFVWHAHQAHPLVYAADTASQTTLGRTRPVPSRISLPVAWPSGAVSQVCAPLIA